MTDTDARTAAQHATGTADSALQHPHSKLHQDATDDLTANTEADGASYGLPRENDPQGDGTAEPDILDDAADYADGSLETADHVPGDGTVGSRPPHGDVDVMPGSPRGREADAARADTSDTAPTPTETHAD